MLGAVCTMVLDPHKPFARVAARMHAACKLTLFASHVLQLTCIPSPVPPAVLLLPPAKLHITLAIAAHDLCAKQMPERATVCLAITRV